MGLHKWSTMGVSVLVLLVWCATLTAGQTLNQSVSKPIYPPLDGSGNNANNPTWGKAGSVFKHVQVPVALYRQNSNGSDALTGANRPSARAITLALLHKPYFKAVSSTNGSILAAAVGQLISADINRGEAPKDNGDPSSAANIPVPPADPYMYRFDNVTQLPVAQGSRSSLPFSRASYTRSSPTAPRQQINAATAWLDASSIYGQSPETARTIRAGTAGRLLMDEGRLLPLNLDTDTGTPLTELKNTAHRVPQTLLRLSGNANVNQNPLLLSITTVMVREHNRRARLVEAANPEWGDEEIFQEARKWVIGHFQRIALVDYMAAISLALPPYRGYNASLDPSIDTFFTTVAYRYGHSTINDVVLRLDKSWAEHSKGHLLMSDAFFNPNVALEAGLEPLVRGMIAQRKGKVEPRFSLAMAGNFAGQSGVNGTDIPAINIQRARDHGVPDYNTCRRVLGLPAVKNSSDVTPDEQIAATLKELYGNVNNIDPYVGGLAEAHQGGAHMGPLFAASITEQFARLRDADWWYYENGAKNKLYSEAEIAEIRGTSLRDILLRTTSIKDLPTDIWTATNPMTCAAGPAGGIANLQGSTSAGAGGARNKLVLPALLGGTAALQIDPGSEPGWVKVTLSSSSSSSSGWLGFGVADPGSSSAMIGADMVIGRMADGAPQVMRYKPTDHQPPTPVPAESQAGRLRVLKFEQQQGAVRLEFERPADGGGADLAMPTDGALRLIIARGPSNDIGSMQGYHGTSNREVIELKEGLFGAASTSTAVGGSAVTLRRTHGILMAVNFVGIFPLGALAARQLRCHWLRSPAVRASLFYVHVFTQVSGVAVATAGFVLATRWFQVPYSEVQYGHGRMGVAILVIVYLQLLVGFVRPHANASASLARRRHIWDIVHTTLGRAAMLIGLANVGLGITIFCFSYGGNFSTWAGVCAAGLGAITLLQHVLDRQEKYAVLSKERESAMQGAGRAETQQIEVHPSVGGVLEGTKDSDAGLSSQDDRRSARD